MDAVKAAAMARIRGDMATKISPHTGGQRQDYRGKVELSIKAALSVTC
jgi:hypothetical protein